MTTIQFNNQLLSMQKKLRYFAYSLTGNHDDAFDLLQETSLKALIYKDQFEENTNFKAWMFTIMKNTFINSYRRRKRTHNTFEGYDDDFNNAYLSHFSVETPEMIQSQSQINETIGRLGDEFRVPFQMHVDGYKYKEIAKEMNLPIGTVKSRIFFSRKKLRHMLADQEGSYDTL